MAEVRLHQHQTLLCPSAQPDMSGARIVGVVGGSPDSAGVAYVSESIPVTEGLLASTAPLKATELFRIAGDCEEVACRHFEAGRCKLATRIVNILPAVVNTLPRCTIRATCRWYAQEGKDACYRCPQVVTLTFDPNDDFRRAANCENDE